MATGIGPNRIGCEAAVTGTAPLAERVCEAAVARVGVTGLTVSLFERAWEGALGVGKSLGPSLWLLPLLCVEAVGARTTGGGQRSRDQCSSR